MPSSISVRLDEEALRALGQLGASGLSRSEAIRQTLVDSSARLNKGKALVEEVAILEADEADRSEMQAVAAFMEGLRAPG